MKMVDSRHNTDRFDRTHACNNLLLLLMFLAYRTPRCLGTDIAPLRFVRISMAGYLSYLPSQNKTHKVCIVSYENFAICTWIFFHFSFKPGDCLASTEKLHSNYLLALSRPKKFTNRLIYLFFANMAKTESIDATSAWKFGIWRGFAFQRHITSAKNILAQVIKAMTNLISR